MTQYSFTTNIENRTPWDGKVYCIDRMTSDYAEAHPLDAGAFIESVYQEFAGTEFEESREVLRSVWNAVLSDMNPRGDVSLYPNKNGQHRAAAMKVWHKAGDYWRRGLRIGDTLPDMVPMTKITRLDDGSWIALFPKDMHLLESQPEPAVSAEPATVPQQPAEPIAVEQQEAPTEPAVTEPVRNQSEPQQLDLFALEQLQQENERLQEQIAQMAAEPYRGQSPCNPPSATHTGDSPRVRRQRKPRAERQEPLTVNRHQTSATLKAVGMVAAATVALFVIYETGLLIPLGLLGLATGGILK